MSRSSVVVCLVCAVFLTSAFAANNSNQAAVLVAQSYAALTGGNPLSDVTLNATATTTAGSYTASQPVVLKALGTDDSRIDIVAGASMAIRNSTPGYPQGVWTAYDGTSGTDALHNCWTDAAWFVPEFSSIFGSQNVSLSYIGLETLNGNQVQHLQVWKSVSGAPQDVNSSIQTLSTMDVYLDALSLLPDAIRFNAHPDNDSNTNLPVEIDFSNYQAVNGIQLPFHIQRFLQGSLSLDIVVTSATLNSGLTDSDFQFQ